MTRLFHQAQHLAQIPTPRIQRVRHIRLGLERDDPPGTVDARIDGLVGDELADGAFGSEGREIEELGEAREGDAGVVLRNHADVLYGQSGLIRVRKKGRGLFRLGLSGILAQEKA